MKQEPLIHVGILSAPEIKVALLDEYYCPQTGRRISGPLSFSASGGMVSFDGDIFESVSLEPIGPNASFEVFDVTIGVNFHWQRRENQRFSGIVRIINENGVATLINILPVEDYLCSVISSEMSATASLEFLKAHAINGVRLIAFMSCQIGQRNIILTINGDNCNIGILDCNLCH